MSAAPRKTVRTLEKEGQDVVKVLPLTAIDGDKTKMKEIKDYQDKFFTDLKTPNVDSVLPDKHKDFIIEGVQNNAHMVEHKVKYWDWIVNLSHHADLTKFVSKDFIDFYTST